MANKKCLVFETMNNINASMHIVESTNPKEIRLTGVFGVAGVKNNNNRIYDKQNYGMMVESLQKVIATEGCLGELEHPNSMNINLNNVSHKIESIEMNEDGTVTGTIVLIDTDKGRNAKAIIEAGVPLYISSRAAGSIDESGHVTLTTLKTYDLVGTPGFSQAKLNLSENQTFESINESCCIIYENDESDDLLGDEDNKDDKDKDTDTKGDKDNKDKDDKDSDDDKDKDNNKNKDNKEATMQDLKEAIDKLSEKIEGLTADLHVAQESLQAKDEEIKTLTEKLENLQIPEVNYSAIQKWVEEEFANDFKDQLMESIKESIDEEISNATETITEGVQNWAINEFAPVIQNYITEEFAPEVQNWVVEEFAPEVQNWITEEYSPEVQNWITEEFAPVVEGWITEEFAPTIDNWINEEFAPEQKTTILEEVNNNVNAFMEAKKQESLSNIDNLLEAIEKKGQADDALELLKEKQVDDKFKGIYVVENMPAEYQPKWAMLTEAQQQDIIRRSKMYNFTKPGVLESFWSTIDFEQKQITENKEEVIDTYHSGIFRQMANLRKGY